MKRNRISLPDIAALDNLMLATWKAARGKRHRPDVVCFTSDLDDNLKKLADDILHEKVPYGIYRHFYIHDPKRRLIHAACFADRVLHHAIMNLAEPVFERALAPTTFACRPNKGSHKAVLQVQRNLQRFPWYVKTDIAGYFPSIDHGILLGLLRRRFKGRDFLALLGRIVASYEASPGKGLPIGSLTSQHFANYYLDRADRLLLEHQHVSAHVRYMDDVMFWCRSREVAKRVLAELRDYLLAERCLLIKPDVQIHRSVKGVTYCGYRVFPGAILLTRRKRLRYRLLRQQWETAWQRGEITELQLQHAYASIHAITLHADSQQWRRRSLQTCPGLSM